MITVGMNYEVIEGKQDEFEKVFAKVLSIMKGMEGHGESHLYRDVSSPRSYMIVSGWTDQNAFDAFIASEQFRNVANWGKEKILASRPRHEIFGRTAEPGPGSCPAGMH